MRLTKSAVDKIESPTNGQAFYRDDQLKGFALRITASGIKSFVLEKLVNGKVRRMTLGRYGELTVEQARKEAQKLLGQIATGIDPLAKKKADKLDKITLDEVFQDYLKARKQLKPKTVYEYQKQMNLAFVDWRSKPFMSITKDKVVKHHTLLGSKHGQPYANSAMRLLRALFNFAEGQYENSQGQSLVLQNPVKRLSQTRAWFRVNRRQSYIKPHSLLPWYNEVMKLDNETLRDYLLLILFTGLRRNEAAKLKWSDVDLKDKTLAVYDTKNSLPHLLPLSNYLYDLLQRRYETAEGEFVFSGTGKLGYIIEPRKQVEKVKEASGVTFMIHDLRRTFITIAESLDISVYAVKRLLNHKMNNDVTAGYIVSDVERLRKPMQQIADYIFAQLEENTV